MKVLILFMGVITLDHPVLEERLHDQLRIRKISTFFPNKPSREAVWNLFENKTMLLFELVKTDLARTNMYYPFAEIHQCLRFLLHRCYTRILIIQPIWLLELAFLLRQQKVLPVSRHNTLRIQLKRMGFASINKAAIEFVHSVYFVSEESLSNQI